MSRVVTLNEIMGRLAVPGFKRFQQAMPGASDPAPKSKRSWAAHARAA
jgi:hypothetical protein